MTTGRKTGGGSRAGIPNKATAEIKALAGEHGPAAVRRLARLMVKAKSEQAQVAACKELLDRAYGKAAQPIQHELDLSGLTDDQIAALALALGAPALVGPGADGDREAPRPH